MSSFVENLFLTGCVLKTNIKIWSGKKKLNPEFIGINPDEVNKDLVSLGSMYLLPKEEIDNLMRIRTLANQVISRNSFDFDFGSFVSNKKLDGLKSQLESIKAQFDEAVEDLKNRFPELSQQIKNQWNSELVSMAASKGDSDLVFKVMGKIENCFKSWEDVESRFDFSYKEYRDINDIAKEFVYESTKGIVEKMGEFASNLKTRIEDSSLSERNLKPVRIFLESLKDSMEVFQNEKLTDMFNNMDGWVMESTAEDIFISDKVSKMAADAMGGIVKAADSQIDEIARASVESMTNFKRKIKK